MEPNADIALIGLAVMGQNLILNMNDHGFTVVAFNRTVSKVDDFINNEAKGTKVIGAHSLQEMAALLKKPRRVMLMVKAGAPVDEFIEHLLPVLEQGDIIIDGGNSLFEDTMRRTEYVESKGLLYIGTGVSGGEEGARHGPSIMPGGSPAAASSFLAITDSPLPCLPEHCAIIRTAQPMRHIAVQDGNHVTEDATGAGETRLTKRSSGRQECLPVPPGFRFATDLPLQGDRRQTRNAAK